MRSAAKAVQKAIYNLLSTDIPDIPVYAEVPDGSSYPHIVIGESTAMPWYTKIWDGQEVTVTVHAWVRSKGTSMEDAKDMGDRIVQSVTENYAARLQVDGYVVADVLLDMEEYIRDIDGETAHGVIRFRMKLQEV